MKRTISSNQFKTDQIRIRLSTRDKEILELAARLTGCSVSEFLRRAGIEAARGSMLASQSSSPSSTHSAT